MALESLPGSQLWDRCLLLATDPARRAPLLEREHAPYLGAGQRCCHCRCCCRCCCRCVEGSSPACAAARCCAFALASCAQTFLVFMSGFCPAETVPFRTIALFTLFQLLCLGAVYAVTWAGVAGCD